MQINRFEPISGTSVQDISGQSRYGYSLSDTTDFYDMTELLSNGGHIGTTISFYDYDTRKVYEPFSRQWNVLYGNPVYLQNYFWFLQGNYNTDKFTLYKYLPGEMPEKITQLNISDVNPYNLHVIGEDIHIVSEDEAFECYYPEPFKFQKELNETVEIIAEGKVYLSAWMEEGLDEQSDCATEDYRYYEKLIIRDFEGNVLSEEVGYLEQRLDGTWWMS